MVSSLKTLYDIKLIAISPIHIGSGSFSERDFDYVIHQNKTYFFDVDQIGHDFFKRHDSRIDQLLKGIPPGRFLKQEDLTPNAPFFRYVLNGAPVARSQDTLIREAIKSVSDQAYIPGSSIKGALRTIISRKALVETGGHLDLDLLGDEKRPKQAADRLEQEWHGRDPNHDIFRALHVIDSNAIPAEQCLFVRNARIFTKGIGGPSIALECIKPDLSFQAEISIEDYYFDDKQARDKLEFAQKDRTWFREIIAEANRQAEIEIKQELSFYDRPGDTRIQASYKKLLNVIRELPRNMFFLRVGWGGSWDSKTLGPVLDHQDRQEVLEYYELGEPPYSKQDPFPRSRRAVSYGPQETSAPIAPFGWLLVEMTKRM